MNQEDTIEPSHSSSAQDDEDVELFSEVLSVLQKEQLPQLGSALRQRIQPNRPANCAEPVVGRPMYGSFHVLFPLTFDDGLRWLVKIPINGSPAKWDEASASALLSEANTMRLLKRETTIPVPEVLDFSSTTENPLRCPYIIVSFVFGKPLYDVWFGNRLNGDSDNMTLQRRTRALETIVSAMLQMNKFSFRLGGSPRFDDEGNLSEIGQIGQMCMVDHKAMLDRWFVHKDPDGDPIYVDVPTSNNPTAYYTCMLDLHPEQNPTPKGVEMLLRQLVSWIPESSTTDPFVLAHPDYDIQNFIVSEEGELLGLIDWDGVAAVPRSLGNERYPGWLTRDWDPAMYAWTPSMASGDEPKGLWEDSPSTLAYYRDTYDKIIAKHCPMKSEDNSATDICRMSLITDNLAVAAHNPHCRHSIVRKIVQEIWIAAGKDTELHFMDLAEMFANQTVDKGLMETIHTGFNVLLTKKWL